MCCSRSLDESRSFPNVAALGRVRRQGVSARYSFPRRRACKAVRSLALERAWQLDFQLFSALFISFLRLLVLVGEVSEAKVLLAQKAACGICLLAVPSCVRHPTGSSLEGVVAGRGMPLVQRSNTRTGGENRTAAAPRSSCELPKSISKSISRARDMPVGRATAAKAQRDGLLRFRLETRRTLEAIHGRVAQFHDPSTAP